MFYRVFREYPDGDDIHVGVFKTECDAIEAAESEALDTRANVVVVEEDFGHFNDVTTRELHRFHGKSTNA